MLQQEAQTVRGNRKDHEAMTGNDIYPTLRVVVEHVEVPTALAYDDLIHAFERELGRLDAEAAQSWIA